MHWGRGNIYYRNNIYIGNPYWRGRLARILPGLPPTVLSAAAPASGLPTPDVPGSAATHVSPAFDSGRQSRCIRLSRRLEEEDHRVQEVVAAHGPPRGPRRNLGPTPAVPMPAQKDSRGYGMGRSGSKIGAFSPSPSDAEIRAWGTRSQLRDLRPRRSLQLPPGRHGLAPAPRKNYTRSER